MGRKLVVPWENTLRHLRSCVVGILIGAAVVFAASCGGNEKPPIDGGKVDAGTVDAGTVDAGTEDAGMENPDSGMMEEDAGTDAGMDAGIEVTPFASYADYAQARTDAICQAAVTCGVFTNLDACKSSDYLESYDIGLDPKAEAAALNDARATFDGTQARICVDQLTAASCAGFSAALKSDACKTAVSGAVAVDGTCFNMLECGSTAYCNAIGDSCPGTCIARKAEGESANNDIECLDGLWADRTGVCAKKIAVGQSCAGMSPFLPPKECVDSAWCDDNRICQAKGGLNAMCNDDLGCLTPYVCSDSKCVLRAGSGAICTPYVVPCAIDLVCDASAPDQEGTCAAPKGEGSACFQNEQCETGLFCRGDPTPDHCAQPNGLGDACQPFVDGECASDAYCDSTSNTCQAKAALGQPCTDWNSCLGNAWCDGVCKPNLCEDPTP